MGDPKVFSLWSAEELDAIQWDTIEEEMSLSVEYDKVASYDELITIYNAVKRAWCYAGNLKSLVKSAIV